MGENIGASEPESCLEYRGAWKPRRKGVCLTLVVPRGKRRDMCRILKPLIRDVCGLAALLDVTESADAESGDDGPQLNAALVPKYTVSSQELSVPALALMLFLPERSKTPPDAETVRQRFLTFPWRYHHAIQLQSATTSTTSSSPGVLGQQDFYFLSRQLPLWSVSAGVHKTGAVARINIFVRRFSAMVEFYRLITNSEMESRKPGFCLFPLSQAHPSSQSSDTNDSDAKPRPAAPIVFELALKHCPLVNPYPLADSYLSFPVANLQSILNILPTQARPLPNHCYLVHDPDGNAILVYDSAVHDGAHQTAGKPATAPTNEEQAHRTHLGVDKSSERSSSVDSGRYSDFEASSMELETCMSRLVEEVGLLQCGKDGSGFDSCFPPGHSTRPANPESCSHSPLHNDQRSPVPSTSTAFSHNPRNEMASTDLNSYYPHFETCSSARMERNNSCKCESKTTQNFPFSIRESPLVNKSNAVYISPGSNPSRCSQPNRHQLIEPKSGFHVSSGQVSGQTGPFTSHNSRTASVGLARSYNGESHSNNSNFSQELNQCESLHKPSSVNFCDRNLSDSHDRHWSDTRPGAVERNCVTSSDTNSCLVSNSSSYSTSDTGCLISDDFKCTNKGEQSGHKTKAKKVKIGSLTVIHESR